MKESIKKSKILKEIINDLNFETIDSKNIWKLDNISKWEEIYDVKMKC